jgi:hypothetical protein
MTQNAFGFDLQDKDLLAAADGPSGDFTPVPAGWYDCLVDKSEAGTTAKGDDKVSMTFVINTGEYQGRLFWGSFPHGNKNQQSANIARSQMAKIAEVAGIDPKTADQFENARVGVKVGVEPAKGEYKAKNKVLGIGPIPEDAPQAAPAPAPATTAGGRKASW